MSRQAGIYAVSRCSGRWESYANAVRHGGHRPVTSIRQHSCRISSNPTPTLNQCRTAGSATPSGGPGLAFETWVGPAIKSDAVIVPLRRETQVSNARPGPPAQPPGPPFRQRVAHPWFRCEEKPRSQTRDLGHPPTASCLICCLAQWSQLAEAGLPGDLTALACPNQRVLA
jgi:hypothetical protein